MRTRPVAGLLYHEIVEHAQEDRVLVELLGRGVVGVEQLVAELREVVRAGGCRLAAA